MNHSAWRNRHRRPATGARLPLLAGVLFVACCGSAARAQVDAGQFQKDLEAIAAPQSRTVGSAGYEQTAEYLRAQIKALAQSNPNVVTFQEQTFPVIVPVTRSAKLTLADGSSVDVYPFWPAAVRVNSTPTEGIQGRLVYCREAYYSEIRPGDVAGQIAVVESTANWPQAAYFGARAIVVLEKRTAGGGPTTRAINNLDRTSNIELRNHELAVPVNIPRFYIPEDEAHRDLVAALRAGKVPGVATLKADVGFEKRPAHNFYVLVRSKQLAATAGLPPSAVWAMGRTLSMGPVGWSLAQNPAAMMISAPYDAGCLVPDLAHGAGQAVQPAAALGMMRDFASKPLNRPVMFFFGGADSMLFRATREMLMSLADPPGLDRGWKEQLATLVQSEQAVAHDLDRARKIKDDPTQLDVAGDRSLIDRIVKLIETDIYHYQDELFRLRRARQLTDEQQQRIAFLEDQVMDLGAVRHGIQQRASELGKNILPTKNPNRALTSGEKAPPPSKESESLLPPARVYMAKAIERMEQLLGQRAAIGPADDPMRELVTNYAERRQLLERRMDLYHWLANELRRNPDPVSRSNNSRLIDILVALDISDGGTRIGPLTFGHWLRSDNISNVQDWREWLSNQDKNKARWLTEEVRAVFDTDPLAGARAKPSWLCASMAIGSEPAQAWGVPGLSLVTLDDSRMSRDTPVDLLVKDSQGQIASPKLDVILPQVKAVREMLFAAANDEKLKTQPELKWTRNSTIDGMVVSPAVGRPVPDLPRPGFVATFYYAEAKKSPKVRVLPYTAGMRKQEIVPCDAEGNYRFDGLTRLETSDQAKYLNAIALEVYRFGADGSITGASDLGKQAGDVKLNVDVKQDLDPVRSLVFNCEEFALMGLYDPRFLQDLAELSMLDARRNAEPQRYNFMIHKQMIAGLVEPGDSSYLLFRYGRVGNRLILLNTGAPATQGRPAGFLASGLSRISVLAKQVTEDFYTLDDERLKEYRKVGVQNDLVDRMHQDAADQLAAVGKSIANRETAEAVMRNATGAWANEARVYNATRDLANDVIRAAIFLLLLAIPFSFCMERLLIGTPNIYKQITYAGAIFAVMAVALAVFHPAFKISASPLIIILAFAIIFMSIVVIGVVYSKFDTELKRIRSGRGTAATTSFARASVLMSAVLLGIANMRKRKFRTTLTCITIVLITFAVLCFTSASRYLDTTSLPTGEPRRYYGLMMRQRGFRPMPASMLDNLRSVLNQPNWVKTASPGDGVVVERWWNVSTDYKEVIDINTANSAKGATAKMKKPFPAQAILGLSPGESKISEIGQVIKAFDRLENGEQYIVYLASSLADNLGVKVGDKVVVGGIELEVAGTFDASEFDSRVLTLAGDSIAPLNYQTSSMDAGGVNLSDQSKQEGLTLDADDSAAELANVYEHLSSTNMAIVPAAISRRLPNASLRTIGLKLADTDEVQKVSRELAKRFAVAMFAGDDDGVRMVAASNLAKVSGAGQVAIPLAIAGLIIFNTMMGSIAERRREIHVYTSLGLAPVHVGALFVAEALTYGLIGTVFGYIIGQGVGTVLLKTGLLGSVTLNYSGTSAMMTMGLILVIVLLSALVPARLASKIAAPSIERSWKVPLPKGDEIIAVLPFTINKTAADGVLAYLNEYFDAHQEGSIGKFSAGKVEFFHTDDGSGRISRGLKTIIWLTPFDLGVRQHLMLLIHPGQYEDIYEVQVVLGRMSGDDGSWYRMNRTFLTELRKQFLQWRSLSPQRMLQYVEESKRVLAQPTGQIVTTTGGEEVRLA